MIRISRCFCIPFIIACISSILFIYHLSCRSEALATGYSVLILTILAAITIIVGIFTDCSYTIRERICKKKKNE